MSVSTVDSVLRNVRAEFSQAQFAPEPLSPPAWVWANLGIRRNRIWAQSWPHSLLIRTPTTESILECLLSK